MTYDLIRDQTLIRMALTVRLAWDLHRLRIRARPVILDELRTHVLLSLPEPASLAEMERISEYFLMDYLDRVRLGRYRPIPPEPASELPISNSWRLSIEAACDPLALSVFRLRYGDGQSPSTVARVCGLDISEVHAALEGLREIVRLEAVAHGFEENAITSAILDRLLSRAAASSGDDCPMPEDLVLLASGVRVGPQGATLAHHAQECPRCGRAIRLLRANVVSARDFTSLPDFPEDPPSIQLVAIHVHPQARRHFKGLLAALGAGARASGEDSILLDTARVPEWDQILARRARLGQPGRDHLRAALVYAPGLDGTRCILGPAPLLALETSRSRPWGQVDTIPELPEPIPPPLNVARLWSSAIVAGLLAFAVGSFVLLQQNQPVDYPIESEPTWNAGDLSVRFDVDDLAFLNAFTVSPNGVNAVLESTSPADKILFATGEGDFIYASSGAAVVLISGAEPMTSLGMTLHGSPDTRAGQREIRERVHARYPSADVVIIPAYPPS